MIGNRFGVGKHYHWKTDAKGRRKTDEHRKKIADALRGKSKSAQHRLNLWNTRKRMVSEKQKQLISESLLRRNSTMRELGYEWTGRGWRLKTSNPD
jgi:hypothetical protein